MAKMNNNVMIVLLIFVLFFIYSQYYAESFGGTSWFPRSYLKYISNTMENFVNTISGNKGGNYDEYDEGLESPNFSRFDIGNRFTAPTDEVDGLYFNTVENKDNEINSLLFNQSNLGYEYNNNNNSNNNNDDNVGYMGLINDEILYKRGGNASKGQWYHI